MIEVFSNLTTVLKIYMTLPVTSCESERNFYKLPIIINHVRGMTELSFESVCRKSYYKRVVIRRGDQKSIASKKCKEKKYYRDVSGS